MFENGTTAYTFTTMLYIYMYVHTHVAPFEQMHQFKKGIWFNLSEDYLISGHGFIPLRYILMKFFQGEDFIYLSEV